MRFEPVAIVNLETGHTQWGLYCTYNGGIAGGLTDEREALALAADQENAEAYYCEEVDRQSY